MVEGTVGMGGFPPCAGFFSKDSILLSAFQSEYGGRNVGYTLYGFGLATALLTAFYMFRLIFLTFHGKQRYDEHHVHVHESPNNMLVPLMILAVLSIVGGWFAAPAFLPGGTDYFAKFLQPVFSGVETAGGGGEGPSLGGLVAGGARLHRPSRAARAPLACFYADVEPPRAVEIFET